MNDMTLPEMSVAEAQRTNAAIKAGITTLRALLLDMRDRKGWKALGYSSFEEYGKTELDYGQSRLYQLASAAEIQASLSDSTIVESAIPESHLRPLAPLTDDERRKVWEEATAQAEAEQKKLTAKMVQEAVDRLNAEKESLQSKLDLAEKRAEDFRQQDNARRKALKEQEELAKTAQSEAATLRRTIAQEAERLASAKILELRQQLDTLNLDKTDLQDKIRQLRKEQDAAAETKAKQLIQAQQDEINRREAQLRTIEGRIETLNQRLIKVDQQDTVVAHFEQAAREIRATLNTLGHQIQVALDEEDAPFLPAPFVPTFEKLAEQLEQGAAGVRAFLANADVRQLEVLTNG